MLHKYRSKMRWFLFRVRVKIEDGLSIFIGKIVNISRHYSIEKLKDIELKIFPIPFPRDKKKQFMVEIGSGHGEVLERIAKNKVQIVGFEWRKRFARESSIRIARFDHAFVYYANAYKYIPMIFEKQSIDGIYVLFPDPWHKEKHHKRRPLTKSFFEQMEPLLVKGGFILFASDWQEYVDFVKQQVSMVDHIYDIEIGEYVPEKFDLPATHYYKKWVRKNRQFTYILLKKRDHNS